MKKLSYCSVLAGPLVLSLFILTACSSLPAPSASNVKTAKLAATGTLQANKKPTLCGAGYITSYAVDQNGSAEGQEKDDYLTTRIQLDTTGFPKPGGFDYLDRWPDGTTGTGHIISIETLATNTDNENRMLHQRLLSTIETAYRTRSPVRIETFGIGHCYSFDGERVYSIRVCSNERDCGGNG
ncbi:hypothetical protein [Xenorhabdus doucetiae]|uniref:Lipoprotein n=1 Tax=Xenorhabdus doucetiae TaxID=351671 RepID=A0A068QX53_9GAMM|nr:hypothetical protein [Xenorhabdus doucetiae]TYP11572.1 hypothetical protein LY16_01058 [Xenorhabdus doucetiae]CDG18430.1 exported protein of unknown function [Xenorhabdus doucetiae]